MSKFFEFKCGCKFPIVSDNPMRIRFDMNFDTLNYNCPYTWELIQSGNTKGVFQLESRLGQSYAKKLKPECMEHLAALNAVLRPGCLESIEDGKSLTQRYIDRKNGVENVSYKYEILKPHLESAYGTMIYQEQALAIVKDVAGFSGIEAEGLRKACGKKDAKKMAEVEQLFYTKAKELGKITDEQAQEIFSWIKASQRYSFNKCLSPDTSVEKDNGTFVTLKNIRVGDKIRCPSKNGDIYSRVVRIYDNGMKYIHRATLKGVSGKKYQIECTLDHKFLTAAGLILPLKDIFCYDFSIVTQSGFKQVVKLEKLGFIPTIDIEVDNADHLFYGNGIATSNSHAVGYAFLSYLTAYCKAHFGKNFFASYLYHAQSKQDPKLEVYELINNAKSMYLDVVLPNICYPTPRFHVADNKIRFGLTDIKNVGASVYKNIKEALSTIQKHPKKWTWLDYLFLFSDKVNSKANESMISCGCLDHMNMYRFSMLYEYKKLLLLTDKELNWCKNNYNNDEDKVLVDVLKKLIESPTGKNGGMANKNSAVKIQGIIDSLLNPPHELVDSAEWCAASEESCLGIAISCSSVDGKDTVMANCDCREFATRKDYCIIAGKIDSVRETTVKNGNSRGSKMLFMTISDSTGSLDCVLFKDELKQYRGLAIEGNTVLVCGEKSRKMDSMTVKKIIQI